MSKDRLIPEARVDRNGVRVTRYVKPSGTPRKNGLLAQLMPSLVAAGERTKLIKKISVEVERALAEQEKVLYRDATERITAMKLNTEEAASYNRTVKQGADRHGESILSVVQEYPLSTLSFLDEAFDSGASPHSVIEAIAFYKDGGLRLREGMAYREVMQGRYAGLNVLDHVRESLGVDDLTAFPKGSDEYQEAAAVLNVAATASAHRIASQTGHRNIDDYEELLERERQTASRFRQMTPELASLIVQHRNRTDDVLVFLEERGVAPADVDIEHLTAYLENPSPAISGGVL